MKRLATYIAWILLSELAGVVGGLATRAAIPTWYAALSKPAWTPPNGVFGPVWTILYALMGIAAARVWIRHRHTSAGFRSLSVFGAQLALNALWSILFFGLESPGGALVAIVILWTMILALVLWWWRLERPSSLLLIPYLAWVSYATALNGAIWQLNL